MKSYNKWAFLLGIEKYKYGFQPLYHATRHVNDFYKILDNSGEFKEIIVLTEEGDDYHKPTTDNIMVKYSRLLKKLNRTIYLSLILYVMEQTLTDYHLFFLRTQVKTVVKEL